MLINFCFLNVWGEVASDLDETWWKFFLQACRSFLYSSGTSETTRNMFKNHVHSLQHSLFKTYNKPSKIRYKSFYYIPYSPFKGPYIDFFFRMGRGFLGYGRNLGEILPTSLPKLPIQPRDLRNNQKSLKFNFYKL